MSNWCEFEMRILAPSKDALERFHTFFYDYDAPRHFWRVCDLNGFDEAHQIDDGKWIAEVYGLCAWSVCSCMCKGQWTYYESAVDQSISLDEASEELGLVIEVYSAEPAMGFQEHYLFDHGDELKNETCNYTEWWYEGESWDEFLFNCNLSGITKDDLDDQGRYLVGGFTKNWYIQI